MRYIVNIDRVINYSQKILKDANIQNSNKEAKLIIGHVTKLSQVEILNSKKTLNNNIYASWNLIDKTFNQK